LKLLHSDYKFPLNIGSEEQVSINGLVAKIENIANINPLRKIYKLDMPLGVRGRNSNNDRLMKVLSWNYEIDLQKGLENTYHWIENEINNPTNDSIKFRLA